MALKIIKSQKDPLRSIHLVNFKHTQYTVQYTLYVILQALKMIKPQKDPCYVLLFFRVHYSSCKLQTHTQ